MSDIEKKEVEAFNEAMENVGPTMEDLLAECQDLQKQLVLSHEQYISMKDRYDSEKYQWRKYRREAMTENDNLRDQILHLHQALEKCKIAEAQEHKKKVATVPKLVFIAFGALVGAAIPYALQAAGVIGPQLSYGIQCGLMMAISWCYALIWDRTRK